MTDSATLRINEIFFSLQGETNTVGLPTVFVRLTGCPLRCQYCDTAYAFSAGELHSIRQVMNRVAEFKPSYVTVTGGEPLAQPDSLILLQMLCDVGYQVSLETSGAMDVAGVDPRVCIILDIKTPGSAECDRNLESNIRLLKPTDQVKFVICDRKDYEWSKAKVDQFDLRNRVREILFSPSFGQLPGRELAEWILADRLLVRMQLQMHKFLWGDTPGH
ncbi:MAG: 7-carboxy-7-deazaguanine synthase QueE [Pseudomonadales bacterium]|nr:7-carboxy-7-deazaguanine synthase QueE [Pseudomonadales bacterium]